MIVYQNRRKEKGDSSNKLGAAGIHENTAHSNLPESSESFAEEATSIQPLDGWRLVVAEGGEESSKPKILQIRAGKVMEKNQRCWSGACFRRKDSTAAQAEAICAGETAAETVAARSVALAWVSVA